MSTSTAMPRPSAGRSVGSYAWPVGFGVAVVLVFVFYRYWLPNIANSGEKLVADWFPITTLNLCVIWAIMAIGLNIVVGYAGLLDLGYVAFWAIGSYTGAWMMSSQFYQVTVHFGAPSSLGPNAPGLHFSFWLVLVAGAAFCALMGVIIGTPTLRLRSDYLAIVTLGFGEIIPQVFQNGDQEHMGFNLTSGTKGIGPIDPIGTGWLSNLKGVDPALGLSSYELPYKFLVYSLIAAFCVFVSLRIRRGRLGRAWLAIREDELAASMMGVSLVKTKLSAYAVGAVFGGLGGVCYATLVGSVFPNFSFNFSITILLMVVLGGMGNVWGVIIGALLIAWINYTGLAQFGNWINDQFNTHVNFTSWNFLIFGVILVLMMLFRREGLLPESRTRLIMREPARTELEVLGADIEAAEAENVAVAEETEEELVAAEPAPRDGDSS
ncbi:MAG TPA: branched-chain amino acid ABC transporter permease [Jatrophihabitantaceae bacterium]|jgi:branched-chain amino acid transport system permease protein